MGAWFMGSDSKDGWSTTPAIWLLILTVMPLICLVAGLSMLITRARERLTLLQRCALGAGLITITGGAWVLCGIATSLRGMGIL